MSDKKNKKSLMERLQFNNHKRFERFYLTFIISSFCFIFALVFCFNKSRARATEGFEDIAKYTSEFESSKTQTRGQLVDVYGNKDRTRAFVLLKFDDPTKISANAENYKVFMNAANVSGNDLKVAGNPVGGVYIFGNTGYAGIYLVNSFCFPYQVYNMTVRLNAELSDSNSSGTGQANRLNDESFLKYDQFTVTINPGAKSVKEINTLNKKDTPDVVYLYNEIVSQQKEMSVHADLYKNVESMRLALNNVEEYSQRLSDIDKVQVPQVNDLMLGDKIVRNAPEDENKEEDSKESSDEETKDKINHEDSSVESTLNKYKDISYDITFGKDFKGSYKADWQNNSVTDTDFIKQNMKLDDVENLNVDQYFAYKNKEKALNTEAQKSLGNITWTLKDGTKVDDLNISEDSTRYKSIKSDIEGYTKACSEYLKLKQDYQTSLLEKLLLLQADSELVNESASVNIDDKAIIVY